MVDRVRTLGIMVEKYTGALETFAVPIMKLNLEPGFNFVEDNCTGCVANVTKALKQLKISPFLTGQLGKSEGKCLDDAHKYGV